MAYFFCNNPQSFKKVLKPYIFSFYVIRINIEAGKLYSWFLGENVDIILI